MIRQIYRFLHPKFQNLFLEYKVDFKPRYGFGKAPHQELLKIIDSNRNNYIQQIKQALSFKENIWTILDQKVEKDPDNPVWNNGFLPGLDIIMIYSFLSTLNPKRYIEVGSGNSTKVVSKAKRDHSLQTEIISIDPMPRAEIDVLADRVVRQPFENIDFDVVDILEEGDILFIDNSHRILPNSDSMVFFLEIFPRLKKGVIVHIHDVYLPYDYPQFMCDRFYTEQYGLAMFLLANPKKYETIFPCYFVSEDKDLAKMMLPIWDHPNLKGVERHGGSFWIRIAE